MYSCSYSPDGENFVDVEYIDSFDQTINLNDVENDTIYLPIKSDFTYSLFGDHISESYVDIIFAGEELTNHSRSKKLFVLDPLNYQSGYYSLKVEINTKQVIGTLAHATNNSGYVKSVWKQWIVVINQELPKTANIIDIDTFNHQLRVRWEMYDDFTFQKYTIRKYTSQPPDYSANKYEKTFQVFDKEINELIDSSFLSGVVSYQLSIQNSNGTTNGDKAEPFVFIDSTELQLEFVDNYKIKYSWSKPALYNNFEKYSISTPIRTNQDFYNVDDTTYFNAKKLPFGIEEWARIEIVPKNHYSQSSKIVKQRDVYIGNKIETALKIFYDANTDQLYGLKGSNTIYLLDNNAEGLFEYKSSGGQLVSSYDRKHIYFHIGQYQLDGFDLPSLSYNGEIYKIHDILNFYYEATAKNISISNNKILACRYAFINTVINLKTKEVLYREDYKNLIKISPNGNYLVSNDSIFQLSGKDYNYKTHFNLLGGYLGWTFLDSDAQNIIAIYNNRIDVINPNNSAIEYAIPFPIEINRYSIDQTRNQIGVYNGSYLRKEKNLYVISLIDGAIVHEIPIAERDRTSVAFSIANNHVISNFGYHLNLNNLE